MISVRCVEVPQTEEQVELATCSICMELENEAGETSRGVRDY